MQERRTIAKQHRRCRPYPKNSLTSPHERTGGQCRQHGLQEGTDRACFRCRTHHLSYVLGTEKPKQSRASPPRPSWPRMGPCVSKSRPTVGWFRILARRAKHERRFTVLGHGEGLGFQWQGKAQQLPQRWSDMSGVLIRRHNFQPFSSSQLIMFDYYM